MNTLKTTFLLTALTLLLVLIGSRWGENGAIFAFVIAAAMNFFSYFYSDKLALRMYNAQPVSREQLPRAYAVVERMPGRLGLPMPKIYVIPTDAPNAFATGRNPKHASVAVTHGILQLLNDDELEGVLAHELGHVKNRDQLMDAAYGEHIYVDDRTIDSHIKRLRKKFKSVDDDFAQIETLYGVGYRYREH